MTIKPSNFVKPNTPKIFQVIGDLCLTIGTLSGAAMAAGVVLPASVLTWVMFAGVTGKFLTKLTGKKDETTDTTTN